MPIRDGNSVRFTAADYAPGSVQRAIAEAQSSGVVGTVPPVPSPTAVAPTMLQCLDGLPHIKKYNERIENAWRDTKPTNWKGGSQ